MTSDTNWTAWTPAERESFFAAIARHRSAAWRVTFVSRAVNLVVALIVAVLMGPLFYGALTMLFGGNPVQQRACTAALAG